jgi:hypothetical protein
MSGTLRRSSVVLVCLLALFNLSPLLHAGDDWRPVAPDELKMTSEPKAKGAPAIYLYRQVDRDDQQNHVHFYSRIKILTEDGRKYGDVEIPFLKGRGNVRDIKARTIRPDGTIADFDGKVYEKMIVKAKGVKYQAKTFSLPDVQVGSIIEYHYNYELDKDYIFDSQWLLSEELFTKDAKFSLTRNTSYSLEWSWPRGLPNGTSPPVDDHHLITLESKDIPAFEVEDYMPPENEMKYRVDFRYVDNYEKNPEKFWKQEDKRLYGIVNPFVDKRKAMESAVAEIVSQSDTPEQKLGKIYARCQKIHNTSFERDKTQQERDREKLREIHNVEDVWKRGYGNGWSITWLFLGLVRAAGFEANPVEISTRDAHIFNPTFMNPADLNTNVVQVKLNGKDLYLDPGMAFAPYGLLPWSETGVRGLIIDKEGGTWIDTPFPDASHSGIERKAKLQLDDSGSLEGTATLIFKGLSALSRRVEENEEDDTARKKYLEDELKDYIPVASEVDLTNTPDWNSSANTLVAEYHVKIGGWASAAGRRTLLSVGVFGGGEKHVFEHANRTYPIYFSHAFEDADDISITLPEGLQVNSVPQAQNVDNVVCQYHSEAQNQNGSLHLKRVFGVKVMIVDTKYYGALRHFYDQVRTGDDQQIVLSAGAATAQN